MSIATQEVRRNRLVIALLAVCLSLAAILQLNGRSVFAIGEGKNGAFATLVQPNPRGVAGGLSPATGPISRWLDGAGRSFGNPHPHAVAGAPVNAAPVDGTAASAGTTSAGATGGTPTMAAAASAAPPGGSAGSGPSGPPPFGGLISQFSPVSGPGGVFPGPTPTPTPPTATPTPQPTGTPPANPTPTPTPTSPVVDPTPPIATPTPPIIVDPTGPVSPVPEPAAWALWLMGFGIVGSLIRWRRRALDAVAAGDAGGDAA